MEKQIKRLRDGIAESYIGPNRDSLLRDLDDIQGALAAPTIGTEAAHVIEELTAENNRLAAKVDELEAKVLTFVEAHERRVSA